MMLPDHEPQPPVDLGDQVLKKMVMLLDKVIDVSRDAALRQPRGTELDMFDLGVFERAISVLHAVRVLVAHGHWETANAPVRQLFELLVNAEEISARRDRELAALQFVNFGSLQMLLDESAHLTYDREKGLPGDPSRVAAIEVTLRATRYDPFRLKPYADGTPRWASSWSNKTVRDLCAASKNRLRMSNYRLLYSKWSEQAHGAPGALVRRIIFNVNPSSKQLKYAARSESVESGNVILMALTFFLELWTWLPGAPDAGRNLHAEWAASMNALLAAHQADGGPIFVWLSSGPPPSSAT